MLAMGRRISDLGMVNKSEQMLCSFDLKRLLERIFKTAYRKIC